MREVASNAIGFLREAAEHEGIDFERLIQGLPPFQDARGRIADRVDWEVYASVLDRLEQQTGLEGVERIGALTARSGAAESIRTIAGTFISSKQLYKAIVRWFGPAALNNLRYDYVELSDGRVRVTIEIPEPYRPCRAFFHMAAGSYRTGPGVLNQPNAMVELTASERRAEFLITPPPDLTVWQRVRRAVRVAVGAERAIAELSRQQTEVLESYNALTLKHAALEQALDRVQKSESSLATTLHSIGDAVITADASGRITRMNPVAERLTGWNERDARGEPLDEVFVLDEASKLLSKNGEERPVACTRSPIRSEGDPVLGVVVVFRDVSAEREREARLARSELLFRSLLDGAPDALVITDAAGRIVRVNAQAESQFGYSRSEMLGRSVETLVATHALDAFRAERNRFEALPNPGTMTRDQQLFGKRKDGSEFPFEISRSPLESEEGSLVLAAFRDLTERRRLEQQVQQAQKMEAIGRLAGGIAHDFNNLLAAMMSFTNFAIESLPDSNPARDDLGEVLRAAERGKALIRQLLAFSRQQVLDPRVVDPREIVAGMEKLLKRILGEDVELRTRANADLGSVRLDPSQFEQIIVNLAANARDAMPRGGQLTIELANATLDEDYTRLHPNVQPGEYVMLAVSDTGTGIPDEVKARIFEPFFTTKSLGNGSGLGLATCYGIVQQLRGQIICYSEVGRGTSMKVYIPRVTREESKAYKSVAPPSARGGSETVLVVEDDPAVRAAAVRSLTRRGYRILEAGSAEAAIALSHVHEGPIHVLLTDLVMPNTGGRELASALVELRPDVRVIYMSGYAEHAVFEHGDLEPGLLFIQKPFVPDDLARKVREALEQGS